MRQITQQVWDAAAPIAEKIGCTIWDVEFVKEAGLYYLRLYIDHPEGVAIEQCEAVSRAVDKWLDEADPIEQSYTLEVSSAGAERVLKRPSDFQQFLGSTIAVRLYKALDGKKEWIGTLESYEDGNLVLQTESGSLPFEKQQMAQVRLHIVF